MYRKICGTAVPNVYKRSCCLSLNIEKSASEKSDPSAAAAETASVDTPRTEDFEDLFNSTLVKEDSLEQSLSQSPTNKPSGKGRFRFYLMLKKMSSNQVMMVVAY